MMRITRDLTVTPSLELFARHLANLFKSEHLIDTNELTLNEIARLAVVPFTQQLTDVTLYIVNVRLKKCI